MAVTSVTIQGVSRDTADGTGTTDYTSSGFGTPDAAIVILSFTSAGVNPAVDANLSIGLMDGTNQNCCCVFSDDSQAFTRTRRRHSEAAVAELINTTSTVIARGAGSMITDGVQIDWTIVPNANRYVTIILFNGLTAVDVGSTALTTTGVNDITSIGFKPHLCFFSSINSPTAPPATVTTNLISFGAAHNNSSDVVTQGSVHFSSAESVTTSLCSLAARDDSCVGQVFNNVQNWKGSAEDFDSSGLSINTGADSPGNDYIFHLAMQLDNADDAWVGIIDTPTSTGNISYTDPGAEPHALILVQTNAQTKNSVIDDGDSGGLAIGFADGTNGFSQGFSDEDAQGTTDTQSNTNLTNVAELYFDDGASTSHVASLNSFLSNGFQLNFSDTDGTARKWLGITLNAAEATPSAILSSAASISATAELQQAASASLSGNAVLTAAPEHQQAASAGLSCTAILNASGVLSVEGSAALSAQAILTAGPELQIAGSTSLAASAALSATAQHQQAATSVLSSAAIINAIGTHELASSAVFNGVATLNPLGSAIWGGSSALDSNATLTADGARTQSGSALLSSAAIINAIGTHELASSAGLLSAAALSATATHEKAAATALSSTATLSAATEHQQAASTGLLSTATLSVTGALSIEGSAVFNGVATLGASPSIIYGGSSAQTATATLGATPVLRLGVNAILQGTGLISAGNSVNGALSATLTGAATLLAREATHAGPLLAGVRMEPIITACIQSDPVLSVDTAVSPAITSITGVAPHG